MNTLTEMKKEIKKENKTKKKFLVLNLLESIMIVKKLTYTLKLVKYTITLVNEISN